MRIEFTLIVVYPTGFAGRPRAVGGASCAKPWQNSPRRMEHGVPIP